MLARIRDIRVGTGFRFQKRVKCADEEERQQAIAAARDDQTS